MLSIVDAKAICRNFTRRDKEIGIENPRKEDNLSKKVAGWDANSTWCGGYWGSKGFACSSRPWAPKGKKELQKKLLDVKEDLEMQTNMVNVLPAKYMTTNCKLQDAKKTSATIRHQCSDIQCSYL